MSFLFAGLVLTAIGAMLGSWRLSWLPAALALAYGFLAVASGSLWQEDNPIVFLTVAAEAAIVVGVWSRPHLRRLLVNVQPSI